MVDFAAMRTRTQQRRAALQQRLHECGIKIYMPMQYVTDMDMIEHLLDEGHVCNNAFIDMDIDIACVLIGSMPAGTQWALYMASQLIVSSAQIGVNSYWELTNRAGYLADKHGKQGWALHIF